MMQKEILERGAQEAADAAYRRRKNAERRYRNEEAAKRPAPVLIYDGEEDLREPAWLMDKIIPAEGLGMLFGESDIGKTFVALNMALAVCTGRLESGTRSLVLAK